MALELGRTALAGARWWSGGGSHPVHNARNAFQFPYYQQQAKNRLRQFRQASLVAVAATGLLAVIWTTGEVTEEIPRLGPAVLPTSDGQVGFVGRASAAGSQPPGGAIATQPVPTSQPASAPTTSPTETPATSVREAGSTINRLLLRAYALLPKLLIAGIILVLAAGVSKLVNAVLPRLLRTWRRGEAFSALTSVVVFLLALGMALSVIAGDARALVGSVGLAGLALSWALQAPIESFTGWLLNSFREYYRVGDRIAVGDVFGNVYNIDFLNTTVWEAGGPGKAVAGAQPTGALITFPNSEVLRSNIINFTRLFAYVWDEVTVGVTNESDLAYTARLLHDVAQRVVGPAMARPAAEYRALLQSHRLAFDVADEPQVYIAPASAWTNFYVRYLVNARERRQWASELVLAISLELSKPEHAARVRSAYPRTDVQLLNPELPLRVGPHEQPGPQ